MTANPSPVEQQFGYLVTQTRQELHLLLQDPQVGGVLRVLVRTSDRSRLGSHSLLLPPESLGWVCEFCREVGRAWGDTGSEVYGALLGLSPSRPTPLFPPGSALFAVSRSAKTEVVASIEASDVTFLPVDKEYSLPLRAFWEGVVTPREGVAC